MSAVDHSIWDELIRRVECAEARQSALEARLRVLEDRVYQPYRIKPAERWGPDDARMEGSD